MRFPRSRGINRFRRGTESARWIVIQALWSSRYSFPRSSAIFASSASITGMSSRMGYTRRHERHFNPDSSGRSSTRDLHTGQTRMSRAYFGMSKLLSLNAIWDRMREYALYQTPSTPSNLPPPFNSWHSLSRFPPFHGGQSSNVTAAKARAQSA